MIRILRVRPPALPMAPFLVAIGAVVGLAGVSLLLPFTLRFEFAGPGRYAYPALPAAAALTAVGMWVVLNSRRALFVIGGLYAVAAAGILFVGALWPSHPLPGPGSPPPTATMVDATGRGDLRGLSIAVDRIARDPTGKATWFDVTITNSGSSKAEWSAILVASAGGDPQYGDYLRSTHMPGAIQPGQSASGWLLVPMDPATVRSGSLVRLRFQDVAVDGYTLVDDVVFDVSVKGA